MATGIFHHIGTLCLLLATALLLVSTISAPVINDIGILKVHLTNRTSNSNTRSGIQFGTFGFCVTNTAVHKYVELDS